nr:hypothetical protein [Tanacetum cinerariifolium]
MFESGSYKSLPEHVALYEALEVSMERAQRDEFLAEKDKSRKRRRNDQDPHPLLPDSDLCKRRRHDTGTSVEDIPMPDTTNISDSEDTDSTHLSKIKQRPEWLKPIPDNERPATPEPAWVIPSSHIPNAENNWANALATTYQAPAENSLLKKTRDMQTFMHYKGSGQALSISKMKATHYLDFGLKLLIPEHMWINETRNLVIRQRVKDFQLGIKIYQKQLNLTKSRWNAKGFEYKHDYTIIDSPRAVVFPVSNNEQKITRFNEIYKFSDGMLTNIMEALDFRVKEYKVNRPNPGMNTQFWTDKDVARSKEFIHAIE